MALSDSIEQLQNFDFGDIDFNNIGSWPGALKAIILAVVFAIVLVVGYVLHVTEKQDNLERAERKEESLVRDYEKKAEQAANLEAYRKQKAEMEVTFGQLLRQLPKETEVPGLLEDITRAALDNDLTINSVDLQKERQTEFYRELPISIAVEGDYHKIGAFVSGVANLSRIVTLHDFSITPITGNPRNLKMTILAKTYRYLDEGQ